jgi:hypothetical protein
VVHTAVRVASGGYIRLANELLAGFLLLLAEPGRGFEAHQCNRELVEISLAFQWLFHSCIRLLPFFLTAIFASTTVVLRLAQQTQ